MLWTFTAEDICPVRHPTAFASRSVTGPATRKTAALCCYCNTALPHASVTMSERRDRRTHTPQALFHGAKDGPTIYYKSAWLISGWIFTNLNLWATIILWKASPQSTPTLSHPFKNSNFEYPIEKCLSMELVKFKSQHVQFSSTPSVGGTKTKVSLTRFRTLSLSHSASTNMHHSHRQAAQLNDFSKDYKFNTIIFELMPCTRSSLLRCHWLGSWLSVVVRCNNTNFVPWTWGSRTHGSSKRVSSPPPAGCCNSFWNSLGTPQLFYFLQIGAAFLYFLLRGGIMSVLS
jgi:hypothetical protein